MLTKKVINQKEYNQIKKGLQTLTDDRRNNDFHFYFKQNNFMENSDITDIYIPLINLLLKIYDRK